MHENMRELTNRAWRAFVFVVVCLMLGTLGFFLIGRGEWSLERCLYMTVITLTTVGYGEVVPISEVAHGPLFVILLLLFGMGSLVYFTSSVVAVFVEGDLRHFWRKRRMEKAVARMENHVIVCGCGTTGRLVVEELMATRTQFAVIDRDEARVEAMRDRVGKDLVYVVGLATDQSVLEEAGIGRARGVIVALPDDKDCLIVAITARQLNRKLRIVSRCHEPGYVERITRAGADAVISPNEIGGMRLVSEMIRPTVVQFLDLMLRDKEKNLRIEQVEIGEGSEIIGKRLVETDIRKITELLVIAARNERTGAYTYNPGPNFVVEKGTVLIVLGSTADVIKLRSAVGR